jgi:tRNA 2-thiocytidine biosynthesis protein TtcA
VPSHLADTALFDFRGLRTTQTPYPGGDIGFDPEAFIDEGSDSERFPLRIV